MMRKQLGRNGEPCWARWSDEELLELRLVDLGIRRPGPFLESCLKRVSEELTQRGIRFIPRTWLSDEWFSPDGIGGFAMPFYLAHPRLKRLERRMMHAVEGGIRRDCLRLIRHETAHAIQHAYRLDRRRDWRRIFGRSSRRYPSRYRPDPTSRDYVHHLPYWYAQCHPDEDFAETFSVWLPPGARWRTTCEGWPAEEKLSFVAGLMEEVSAGPLPRVSRRMVDPLQRLKTTLGEHYRVRRRRFGVGRPSPLDAPLRSILSNEDGVGGRRKGSAVLRAARAAVRTGVAPGSVEADYAFDMVYHDLVSRSDILGLRTDRGDRAVVSDCVRFLRRHLAALMKDPSTREWIPV